MRGPTANVADLIAKTPAVQGLQYMNDKILFLAGGLPIDIDGDVVGESESVALREDIWMPPAPRPVSTASARRRNSRDRNSHKKSVVRGLWPFKSMVVTMS